MGGTLVGAWKAPMLRGKVGNGGPISEVPEVERDSTGAGWDRGHWCNIFTQNWLLFNLCPGN